jgi:predicted dehydrogenase
MPQGEPSVRRGERPLKVVVVGTGHWAADVHIPGLVKAGADVAAVCGRRQERRTEVARRFDIPRHFANWREMLDAVEADAVSVCTPNDLHAPISIAAAGRGMHVCCEKPLATSAADARSMWEAARGVVTMVGFSHRFVPAAQLLKEMVDAGDLGTIHHVFIYLLQGWLADPASPAGWRLDRAQAGGGTLADLGSHLLDLAVWYGGGISRIAGHLKTFVHERPLPDGGTAAVDVDDAAGALAEFGSGATGVFAVSRYVPGTTSTFGTQGVAIAGSQATAIYDPGRVHSLLRAGRGQAFQEIEVPARLRLPSGDLRADLPGAMMGRFVEGARAGKQVRPDFEDGLRSQVLMEAWETSHQTGAWMDVPALPGAAG